MQPATTTAIRRAGVTKTNRLVHASRHLETLTPAFAEWQSGEIYVCRKTSTYRYRFGDRGKSVTPWSALAVELFATAAEFAFAAMVLGPDQSIPENRERQTSQAPVASTRGNIINLAQAAA